MDAKNSNRWPTGRYVPVRAGRRCRHWPKQDTWDLTGTTPSRREVQCHGKGSDRILYERHQRVLAPVERSCTGYRAFFVALDES
jgi:hypothetical protein